MIKFTILLKRKPTLTHDEFAEYHRSICSPAQNSTLIPPLPP